LRKQAIETLIPLRKSAQAGRHTVRDNFKDAAHGVACAQGLVHFSFHALLGFGIGAVEQDFWFGMELLQLLPWYFRVA
jgi:hypothetical protein